MNKQNNLGRPKEEFLMHCRNHDEVDFCLGTVASIGGD